MAFTLPKVYRNWDINDETSITLPMSTAKVQLKYYLPFINNVQDNENNTYDWSKEGYNFIEWNTSRDGTGTGLQPGDQTKDNSYAIWEEMQPLLTTIYGSTINNITSYGTFTLDTKGKFCQNDIVLEFVEQNPVFFINNWFEIKSYEFIKNSTWGEWLDSDYNVDGFEHIEYTIRNQYGAQLYDDTNHLVRIGQNIIANMTYTFNGGVG